MKKTEKELFESHLQGNIWRETKDKIVVCSLFFVLIIVGIWKYEIYTTSMLSAAKWYLLSIGTGFSLGVTISSLIPAKWFLQRKRDINHQRTQNCWAKMNALQKLVENPDANKAKHRLEKVEYRFKKLNIISQLLTNPYKRV